MKKVVKALYLPIPNTTSCPLHQLPITTASTLLKVCKNDRFINDSNTVLDMPGTTGWNIYISHVSHPIPPHCLLPVLAGCCHARRHVSRVRTSRPRDQRDRSTAGHWPASSPPPRPAQRPSLASATGHTQPAARALQTVKLFSIYNCTLLLCKWALNVSSLYPILIMKCFWNIYTLCHVSMSIVSSIKCITELQTIPSCPNINIQVMIKCFPDGTHDHDQNR